MVEASVHICMVDAPVSIHMVDTPVRIKLVYALASYFVKKYINFISNDS
jgi:hypothetical protein